MSVVTARKKGGQAYSCPQSACYCRLALTSRFEWVRSGVSRAQPLAVLLGEGELGKATSQTHQNCGVEKESGLVEICHPGIVEGHLRSKLFLIFGTAPLTVHLRLIRHRVKQTTSQVALQGVLLGWGNEILSPGLLQRPVSLKLPLPSLLSQSV